MHNISVVIPAKNEAHNLLSLLPALREELSDTEIIVVDDGSTDGSAEIAASYPEVRLLRQEHAVFRNFEAAGGTVFAAREENRRFSGIGRWCDPGINCDDCDIVGRQRRRYGANQPLFAIHACGDGGEDHLHPVILAECEGIRLPS